jgi:twitching motility protein PilT
LATENTGSGVDIHKLLQTMVEKGASDLHLTVNSPPCLRIDGKIYPLRTPPLTGPDIQAICYSVLNEKQKKLFEERNEVDLSFRWKGVSRFRANFFRQQGFVAGALRQIPFNVKPLQDLGIPVVIEKLLERPNGLILVTGPTGSGKSTTLASMIDFLNTHERGHIITIEDPIEFLHQHKLCIVNQREVGSDTESFKTALKYVLRQDPDAVLIGEIRDLETMEAALKISETGHLALATLHTNTAIQTIHRMLDFFPSTQQDMVRTQISFVLQCIISQHLIPRAAGSGRVMACEVLVPTAAIRNLIREDKTHQIYSQMQIQTQSGNQALNQCLCRLVLNGSITFDDASSRSQDPDDLKNMIQKSGDDARAARAAQPSGKR